MRPLPQSLDACLYAPIECRAKPPEEVVYRGLTVAAVLLILVRLWAF
jgi:hypothetical protein